MHPLHARGATHLLEAEWEDDVQKEDLVRPDEPLLLCLLVKPGWPLVGDEGVVKTVLTSHVGDDSLAKGGEEGMKEEQKSVDITHAVNATRPPYFLAMQGRRVRGCKNELTAGRKGQGTSQIPDGRSAVYHTIPFQTYDHTMPLSNDKRQLFTDHNKAFMRTAPNDTPPVLVP